MLQNGKKYPYNFTVKFNARSPLEAAAAMYLNDMKNKSPYLASLIVKDLSQSGVLDKYMRMAQDAGVQEMRGSRPQDKPKAWRGGAAAIETPPQAEKPQTVAYMAPASTERTQKVSHADGWEKSLQTARHAAEIHPKASCDTQDIRRAAGIMSTTYTDFFADDDD